MVAQKNVNMLPFAMMFLDGVTNKERGYSDFDGEYPYDARSQVSSTISMGGTLVLSSLDQGDSDTKSDDEDS